MSQDDTLRRYIVRGLLQEVHIVTEWRDGCVYRTKALGYIVSHRDEAPTARNDISFASPSTRLMKRLLSL